MLLNAYLSFFLAATAFPVLGLSLSSLRGPFEKRLPRWREVWSSRICWSWFWLLCVNIATWLYMAAGFLYIGG